VTDTGRILEGVVTSVSPDAVELTLDDGRAAVIHRRNFGLNDEDPSAVLSVGDRAFGAELAREDPKSRVVLSRAWALKRQAWERVVEAAGKNEVVTGRVVSTSPKGLVVDVGVRGFVPSSHLELTHVADVGAYAEQSLELRILEVDPRREKLVLSRRSLLLRAQRKEAQELLNSLRPGEVRTGTVASLADYGAFVDLGGVSGLVHISELSWHRVGKPSDVVSVGDQVEVKVLDVKPKKKRISLSLRQTGRDPLSDLEVGSVVTGRVTRLVDFGAFVAIGEVEGLVHLSELAEYRVVSPEEIVAPGDEVGVKILSVDPKRRRIELSIRRAAEFGG
jgi:small subunit ribosomal protein S1